MLNTLLVFGHLLAAAMALGAIVATDLRLLSKLSQDRLRIAPPNEFVARIVMLALLLLYVTGSGIVWLGLQERADFLDNPKLQVKISLVLLLTLNAFVLHRVTFPRLARGRRVARWRATDWIVIAVPVAMSNFLWMFVAFLGVARPWNYTTPLRDILEVAAALYLVAQLGVFLILAMAGRKVEPDRKRWADWLAFSLASVGNLGTARATSPAKASSRRRVAAATAAATAAAAVDATVPPSEPRASEPVSEPVAQPARPALRLVDTHAPPPSSRRAAR